MTSSPNPRLALVLLRPARFPAPGCYCVAELKCINETKQTVQDSITNMGGYIVITLRNMLEIESRTTAVTERSYLCAPLPFFLLLWLSVVGVSKKPPISRAFRAA